MQINLSNIKVWCELYRPATLEELIIPSSVKKSIQDILDKGAESLPNLEEPPCLVFDMFFKNLKLKNGKITKLIYLDFIGLILYYLNYLLPSKTYPSKFKIQIWDKIFTPLTFIIDFITNYKFGKNIICVIKKIN